MTRAVILAAIVVMSIVALSTMAGSVTAADIQAGIDDTTDEQPLSFDSDGEIEVVQGDTAQIVLKSDDVDEFTVHIGNDRVGYNVTVEVTVDDNYEDDEIGIEMDTYYAGGWAGHDADDIFESNTDGVNVTADRHTTATPRPLITDITYPLSATTPSQGVEAEGVLSLSDRTTDGMDLFVVPSTANGFDQGIPTTGADLEDTLERPGNAGEVVSGDTAVFEVRATGLYSYITEAEDFGGVNGVSFILTEIHPDVNQPTTVHELGVDLDDDNVLFDPNNGRFFVVLPDVDTETYSGVWNAEFHIDERRNQITDSDESETAEFEVVEPDVELDQEYWLIPAEDDQTISGTSNLPAGHELEVWVKGGTDTDQFLITSKPTTGANGQWETSIDLSEHDVGTPLTIDVYHNEIIIDAGTGEIAPPFSDEAFVSNVNAPESVEVGESAMLTVTIENVDEESRSTPYEILIDNTKVASDTIIVKPGNSTSVSHEFDTTTAGQFDWKATVGNNSYDGTLTVVEPAVLVSTEFAVTAPTTLAAGDDGIIEVNFENTGDHPDATNYKIEIDGEVIDAGTVSLERGESATAIGEFTAGDPGEIQWSVTAGNETKTGTITVDEDTTEIQDDRTDDSQPGFGAIIALGAILITAMVKLRRNH